MMLAAVALITSGPARGPLNCMRWMWNRSRSVALGLFVVISVVKIRNAIKRRQRRLQWANAGKDVVIIHCIGEGIYTPSVSPFVMKLATYLRLAQIPHQMDFTEPIGPKGKSPWITMNGEAMGDSQLVMEFLGRHFNKDFSRHLTEEEKAVAWTFALMMDEHICWALRDWRWVRDWGKGALAGMKVPFWLKWMMMIVARRRTIKLLKIHGIGRHSHEEIQHFVFKDLAALSKYLGNKPYLMGDEPCEVDCSVFGCLVQIVYNYPGSPYTSILQDEFSNLNAYVHRMKERLWPDWDDCLSRN